MPLFSRRAVAAASALALAVGLAGCATASGPGSAPALPSDDPTATAQLHAAWLDDGRAVGIVTEGSSTCVPMADEPTYADGVLTVELADPEGQACTKDLVPRASVVTLPSGVDPAAGLSIVVTGTYAGEADLEGDDALTGVPGDPTEYLPSAGWFDSGALVILTWGSSTCLPVAESVTATGPSDVTAVFATPPADQVCTADIAPRVLVTAVDGLQEQSGAHLTLQGDKFDGVRIPIAG
ncbi:hypothetical protein ABC304_01990 [Microbacterium sp. 1P10UB]|uniref:hypothetical protein n=1 Tax=unclassified Microbacterium TaxID=2609290 RepID=UPI00399FE40C